ASFLDPRHASELDHLLKDLNQTEGLTILTVTHDLNHPFFVGGSALVLKEGRQLFFGPAAKLLDDDVLERAFQHRFTTFTHPKTGLPVVLPD
ncbi:MAG: ABC transporter ATP-binding protein, partial [Methylobacteriaceae bacterium]|nr:ABC transporter ATP-binding protein [Methylobacteriaceae bacterium]